MALTETDAALSATDDRAFPRTAAFAAAAAACVAAALLWWRFGESVYASSVMSAILACF
jgi:hypothetical protein